MAIDSVARDVTSGQGQSIVASGSLPTTAAAATVVSFRPDDPLLNDTMITGAGAQSSSGNNIMLATAGTGWVNLFDSRGVCLEIVTTSGISAGVINFEVSNDGTNVIALPMYDMSLIPSLTPVTTLTLAASTIKYFYANTPYLYIRARISTAVTGGTVSCISKLTNHPITLPNTTSRITDGANVNTIKAASTAAAATDTAMVVSFAAANCGTKLGDGTNSVAVKAASTAAATTDPSLVVSVAGANSAIKIGDGTNNAVITAASTAPVATSATLTVTQSPNTAKTTAYNVAWPANITVVTIKSSAGVVYSVSLVNNATSARSFKIYNTASPTVGTTVPLLSLTIPASSTVAYEWGPFGVTFSTGIYVVATGTTTFADTTSTTANDVVATVNYI